MTKPSGKEEITVYCDSTAFQKIRDFVREKATAAGFNRSDAGHLVLAADEACSNILKHTYKFEPNHRLMLTWRLNKEDAVLEIKDDSPLPYLPSPADFDLAAKVKYRHTNGFGKYLMRRTVDDIQYETVPGSHNKVSLIKRRGGKGSAGTSGEISLFDLAKLRSLSYTLMMELAEALSRQEDVKELMKIFLYAVMGRLTTYPVVLFSPLGPASPFAVAGEVGLTRKIDFMDLALPRHGWVIETLWAQRGPFLVEEFRRLKISKEELETLGQINAAVLVPLFMMNQLRGILALGPKRSRRPFTEDDMNWVRFLANYVLLLAENIEKGRVLTGGFPAQSSGDLRASVRSAVARLAQNARENRVTMALIENKVPPKVSLPAETLQRTVFTLLMHILYLTDEGTEICVTLDKEERRGLLTMEYSGTPLDFEKGKPGYNPLIDQMMSGTLKLREAVKAIELSGGDLRIEPTGDKVLVHLRMLLETANT